MFLAVKMLVYTFIEALGHSYSTVVPELEMSFVPRFGGRKVLVFTVLICGGTWEK